MVSALDFNYYSVSVQSAQTDIPPITILKKKAKKKSKRSGHVYSLLHASKLLIYENFLEEESQIDGNANRADRCKTRKTPFQTGI